ncbi:unnamed protein product, partial [Amoebophrya sp. A25]
RPVQSWPEFADHVMRLASSRTEKESGRKKTSAAGGTSEVTQGSSSTSSSEGKSGKDIGEISVPLPYLDPILLLTHLMAMTTQYRLQMTEAETLLTVKICITILPYLKLDSPFAEGEEDDKNMGHDDTEDDKNKSGAPDSSAGNGSVSFQVLTFIVNLVIQNHWLDKYLLDLCTPLP